MANFKLNKWSQAGFVAVFAVLCLVSRQGVAAPAASAGPAKAADDMSFSDALITLKKEEKDKRVPGFRKKGRPVSEKKEMSTLENLRAMEKKADQATTREAKRKKSELDSIKQENRRLEHEIMRIMDEDDQPSMDFAENELPDITPPFPGYARLFGPEGYFHAQLDFQTASWAYDNRNKVVDASKLVVGYDPVQVQDLLLISRLARLSSTKDGDVWKRNDDTSLASPSPERVFLVGDASVSNAGTDLEFQTFQENITDLQTVIDSIVGINIHNHYLNRIADKQIEFKADMKRLELALNFARTFKEVFSLGLEIPVVLRSNKMKMISEFTQSELDEIASTDVAAEAQTGNFFVRYPSGMKDFFRDILEKKSMTPRERHTQVGVGDVSFFVNRKIEAPEHVTAGLVGLGITFPSGVKTDRRYIWPSDLGNRGFWEARGHGNLFWRKSGFFNPHVFGEIRLRMGSSVERRISRVADRKKTRVRDEDGQKAGDLPLGSGFVYNPEANDWKEAESKVPQIASAPLRMIDVNRGAQFKLRVGNLFKSVGFEQAYLDVHYQVEFEQEDNVGFRQIHPEYDVDRLMNNTRRHSHTLGAIYCYKWNDDWMLEFNASHVLSGRNNLRVFQLGAAAQYRF